MFLRNWVWAKNFPTQTIATAKKDGAPFDPDMVRMRPLRPEVAQKYARMVAQKLVVQHGRALRKAERAATDPVTCQGSDLGPAFFRFHSVHR